MTCNAQLALAGSLGDLAEAAGVVVREPRPEEVEELDDDEGHEAAEDDVVEEPEGGFRDVVLEIMEAEAIDTRYTT